MKEKLLEKIVSKNASISVVGLGYVGAPLVELIHQAGYPVEGIDKYLSGSPVELVGLERFQLHRDYGIIAYSDVAIICVPTPLSKNQEPDLSYITDAVKEILANFGNGRDKSAIPKLIILESTSFPGTTNEVVLPILTGAGLELGSDFFLAYAPERVDPGQSKYNPVDIPRVVGGCDADSGELALALYKNLVCEAIRVSTPEVAEMSKLLENIFRAVNIALVNELLLLCDQMEIDIWEVVDTASTKPFGFMSFRPGPGLGGHCIPVDPFYLAWKAREYNFHTEFIELAGKTNLKMPIYVVEKISLSLNERGKSLKDSRVLLVGIAYKEDVGDTRESPGLKIMELLLERGAAVSFHDELVGRIDLNGEKFESVPINEELRDSYDCVALIAPHSYLDLQIFRDTEIPIIDTRGALRSSGD